MSSWKRYQRTEPARANEEVERVIRMLSRKRDEALAKARIAYDSRTYAPWFRAEASAVVFDRCIKALLEMQAKEAFTPFRNLHAEARERYKV